MRNTLLVLILSFGVASNCPKKNASNDAQTTPYSTQSDQASTGELSVTMSLTPKNAIHLAVTNQSDKAIPLKDIFLCIEPTKSYREKITEGTNWMMGFILYEVRDHRGNYIPDHDLIRAHPIPDGLKVGLGDPHGVIFQKLTYCIPSKEKITVVIDTDIDEEGNPFWHGVSLTILIRYNNQECRNSVTFPVPQKL